MLGTMKGSILLFLWTHAASAATAAGYRLGNNGQSSVIFQKYM